MFAAALKQVSNSANPSTSNHMMHTQPALNRALGANVPNPTVDQTFSIVIYGLTECPKGSPRHERISGYDTNLACKTIKYNICPDLSNYGVCDGLRIGKYSKKKEKGL